MRNSNLLKWAQSNNNKQNNKNGNPNWIHSPDALQRGHIAYLVKFLGSTEVDQPKGIEVVKEGIRKLKFNQQLRKAEGNKIPKVELTISIDGVAIQEPKSKRIMNQYPLHRISYCADDKGEKKFFSFIAKEQDSDHHICFVFVSDKLAEEITLTIGQAFDLAYRRFIETSGKDLEAQRNLMLLQQKLKCLENENSVLRQRLSDISKIKGTADVEDYMARNKISNLLTVQQPNNSTSTDTNLNSSDSSSSVSNNNDFLKDFNTNGSGNGASQYGQLVFLGSSENGASPPPVPPRIFESNKTFDDGFLRNNATSNQPSVGTKLEGLLLDDLEDDFNPRAFEDQSQPVAQVASNNNTSPSNLFNGSSPPSLSPPLKQIVTTTTTTSRPRPHAPNGHSTSGSNLFGSSSFLKQNAVNNSITGNRITSGADLFGMDDFTSPTSPEPSQQDLENAIGILDKRLLEMKDGFSRGLAFGNDDFSIESLDPLRN